VEECSVDNWRSPLPCDGEPSIELKSLQSQSYNKSFKHQIFESQALNMYSAAQNFSTCCCACLPHMCLFTT
jgi:hypothetical protein